MVLVGEKLGILGAVTIGMGSFGRESGQKMGSFSVEVYSLVFTVEEVDSRGDQARGFRKWVIEV